MPEKVHDQMITRTRLLLKEALIELIEEKGFEGITIRDLTSKANLNRGTFYLHYRDKYDLMEKIQEEILQGFLNKIVQLNPTEALKYLVINTPYPAMVQVFEYLKSHGRILKVLLGPKGDPSFPKKMKDLIKTNFFEKIILNHINFPENANIIQEYLPAIGTSVNFGIIEKWLENDMPHTPEEMAMIYFKFITIIQTVFTQK